MDGIALALAAARDFPRLTILLMTGFADQRERASGLNAIVHDVVTKPFSVADIRTAVADALAAREAERSALVILQTPLGIVEPDRRRVGIGEAAAQLLEDAADALHVDLAGNLDRVVVAEFAAVQGTSERIGLV